jgi:hypothetical protein
LFVFVGMIDWGWCWVGAGPVKDKLRGGVGGECAKTQRRDSLVDRVIVISDFFRRENVVSILSVREVILRKIRPIKLSTSVSHRSSSERTPTT